MCKKKKKERKKMLETQNKIVKLPNVEGIKILRQEVV